VSDREHFRTTWAPGFGTARGHDGTLAEQHDESCLICFAIEAAEIAHPQMSENKKGDQMQVRTIDNNVGFETFNQNNSDPGAPKLHQLILGPGDEGSIEVPTGMKLVEVSKTDAGGTIYGFGPV
jgi:hypothetical protein